MFNINPLENLRVYISSRPPLVVFMISVSAMAIAFLTLGYFFKIKEIKSPEMTEDWNTFLLRFNDLDFCISENETLKHLINDTTTPENAMTSSQARPSTPSPQTLEDSGPVNTSVAITLTLDPLRPFGGISRNVTGLSSTIFGHQIGLSGREAHEEINITFTLPTAWNSDDCALHGRCDQVVFTTCMTVTAAASVFPVTVQPPHCIPETYINATFWYKIVTTARDSNTKYAQDYNPFWCYKGAIGKVYHALNPKLTVIVPDDDRSLINLHLMHTSYFLFVMVITMFCYAVIRGRPIKLRQSSSEFCPEKDLGMESTSLDDVLYRYASFRNLVDPITHDLIISLARYIHCPKPEGDSLGTMEKLCRQLTYHLSPHSQWRRQGMVKRKPQACLKTILVGNPLDNTVDLSGIPLTMKELDRVISYLQHSSEYIENVELCFTEMTDEMFLQLLPVLSALPRLATLSLNGNRLTKAVLRDLTEALKDTRNFPSMTWIDLGNNVDIFSLPQPFLVSLKKRSPTQSNLPTILEFGESQVSDLESQGGLSSQDEDQNDGGLEDMKTRQVWTGEAIEVKLLPNESTSQEQISTGLFQT